MFALINRSADRRQAKVPATARGGHRGVIGHAAALEPLEGRQLYSTTGPAAIAAEYTATARERDAYGQVVQSLLGGATTGVVSVPGTTAGAVVQAFHDNGAIYWSPATGAHVVYGSIGAEYGTTAGTVDVNGLPVQRALGLPTADEANVTGIGGGRVSTFQGGVVEWSAATGAHAVYGAIGIELKSLATQTDPSGRSVQTTLGVPTADEQAAVDVTNGRVSNFQDGQIYWSPSTGAHVVQGAAWTLYNQMGGSTGYLGLPTADASGPANARVTRFQSGTITYGSAGGAVAHPTSVTIATRNGSELAVTLAGVRDSVTVTQSGPYLYVTADGQTTIENAPADGLFVYTRGGADSVDVDGTVSVRTVVDTVDGAHTDMYLGGSNTFAWVDCGDGVYGEQNFNAVPWFAGGVGKGTGASLPEPSDAGTEVARHGSLFGTGPVITDVNQGGDGDCYAMAGLAGLAQQKPAFLEDMVADLGDGTYAVKFTVNGAAEYVRVSNKLPGYSSSNFADARPGADGDLWAPVVEKAFAYVKSGANTYASINVGNVGQMYSVMGITWSSVAPAARTDNDLGFQYAAALGGGQVVTLPTFGQAPQLVGGHVYTLEAVEPAYFDPTTGQMTWLYIVRNPWGTSGSSLEAGNGVAVLTYGEMCANFWVGDTSN